MSCERTRQIDWAAYTAEPQADEWSSVRAHYPLCPDCAREVARFAELRALLVESGLETASAHPSEEELVAHARHADRLAATRRAEINRHVSGCARCTNELVVLNRLMPAMAPEAAASHGASGGPGPLRAFVAGLVPTARGALITVVLVLALALVVTLARRDEQAAREEVAESPLPEKVVTPTPEDAAPIEPEPATTLAMDEPKEELADDEVGSQAPEESFVRGEAPLPSESTPRVEPQTVPPALAAQETQPPAPRTMPEHPSSLIAGPDAQLAAMLSSTPPRYVYDGVLAGSDLDPSRVDVVVRAGSADSGLRALAPRHLALTFERTPRLYYFLARASNDPIEVIVVHEETDEIVIEEVRPPPVAAGLHALDLSEHAVSLEPHQRYRFFASQIRDEARRDLDVTSGFALEVRPEGAPKPGFPGERANELAAAGSWLDAFAILSRWIEADPPVARAGAHRVALLEQVDLGQVAAQLGDTKPTPD